MKTWAVFTENGIEQCGSDAWTRLDGRLTRYKMVTQAHIKLIQMKAIHPTWNGFVLKHGSSIRDAKNI
jgi:hypothetical protein